MVKAYEAILGLALVMASSRVLFPEEMRIGEGRKRNEKFREEWGGGEECDDGKRRREWRRGV